MQYSYFKRFRMEIDLRSQSFPEPELPPGFHWVPWDTKHTERHAHVKQLCFADEVDAIVFASLSNFAGCRRLMKDISERTTFLPETTWLISRNRTSRSAATEDLLTPPLQPVQTPTASQADCGTIQGVLQSERLGAIQNVGIIPGSRRMGLGRALVLKSLPGFQAAGCQRVYLEVTAENFRAVKLYQSIGFRIVRTTFRVVESRSPIKLPPQAAVSP